MKSGVVTYDFYPLIGGIGRVIYTLYQQLGDQEIVYFSPAQNSLPGHQRIEFWPIRFIKQAGVSVWLHLNAHRIIVRHNLGKLNVHSGSGGVLLVRKLPIPVIVTCHHTYWQQYTYIKSQFWKRIFLPFEKRTYRLADQIVCDCEDTRKVLLERYGIAREKTRVIHIAVDSEKFFPLGLDKKPNTVVYIGRIDTRKGIEFLIRSMPLVVEEIPEAKLTIGGKGCDLEKMKALVRKLGLERNVDFLGFVPEDQLNRLYNEAQVAAVPSVFEGFGITVIEALAAGTRVVGTDTDGVRETVQSGDNGRLAPYGDCRAFADAIVAELKNPRSAPPLPPQYRIDRFRERYREVLG